MQVRLIVCLFTLCFLAAGRMSGADISFSYAYGNADYEYVGTKKAETYDVAIRIADPKLVGSRIKSFSVPIAAGSGKDDFSDVSVWLSRELTVENKVNMPDIISLPAVITEGLISLDFPEPVEIPLGGLYVGYSFTVVPSGVSPVCLAGEATDDGLYIHTTRTYLKWKSQAASFGHSSAMTVVLEGDFPENALAVVSIDDMYAVPGEDVSLSATMVNHGAASLSGIEYAVTDGISVSRGAIRLPDARKSYFGETFTMSLPYTAPDMKGEYSLQVEITDVNGEVNKDDDRLGNALLWVLDRKPIHRPLVEEYTGLWCGWCPAGYVVTEKMNSLYGEDFVAIAYHNGDPMERLSLSEYPTHVSSFPTVCLDRRYITNPDRSVLADEPSEIDSLWHTRRNDFTPAFIGGEATMMQDGGIAVRSEISFATPTPGSYRVAYAVVANGLTLPEWFQSNSYSGDSPEKYIPEMASFCNGPKRVNGLIYDHVYVGGSDLSGDVDSVIEDVTPGEVYVREYIYQPVEQDDSDGCFMLSLAESLDAVIMLLGDEGEVINCVRVPVEGYNGVPELSTAYVGVNRTEYFDVCGRRTSEDTKGILIRVEYKEDGYVAVSKVNVK